MKKRWPLLLLFAVLAAAAWWLSTRNTGSTLAGPLTDFQVTDTASVDRIFIAEKSGASVDLRRTVSPDGVAGWTANGVPANAFQVRLLLKTFQRVEVRSPVPKSAEPNVLKVMAVSAKKVEIYQGGREPSRIWWVGHTTKNHFGTYMLLEKPDVGKSEVPFVMGMAGFTGSLATRFHARLDEWRSSDLLIYPDLTKVKRVDVRSPLKPADDLSITYAGGNDLTLLDGQGRSVPMDSARVKDLLLLLRSGHFESFERGITAAKRDSILRTPPWHVLDITSEKGQQKVRFWRKDPRPGEKDMEFRPVVVDVDRMYALMDDTALVVVQRFYYDRVVPTLGYLRAH